MQNKYIKNLIKNSFQEKMYIPLNNNLHFISHKGSYE